LNPSEKKILKNIFPEHILNGQMMLKKLVHL